ncbi:hypothetical protein JCM14076_10460 [Methylosoma difficile]
MATIKLTTGDDTFLYGSGIDDIDADAGNDILDGGLGNDILFGNTGDDNLAGGGGNDTLKGGDGNDILDGGIGNDTLSGNNGDDILFGSTGKDTLNGHAGNDTLFGGADDDTLYGGTGSDSMDGGDGNDILYDTTDKTTYGAVSTENDEMIGGAGNDIFFGGYDIMYGGDGSDTFTVVNQGTVYGGTGNDTITVTNSNTALSSWLEGGLGSDKITGGSGNDVIFSGYGKDTLIGGKGNDSYVITFDDFFNDDGTAGTGVDTITEGALGGTDTIYYIRDWSGTDADGRDDDVGADGKELDPDSKILTGIDFYVTLANNVENGVLDDQIYVNTPNKITYNIATLNGNALDNNLKGSNLIDILNGGAGNDTINAGDGDDYIYVGEGVDTINGGAGSDTVLSSIDFNLATDSTYIENIVLLETFTAVTAKGDSGNNVIIGNQYDNNLYGGAGNDVLDGGLGAGLSKPENLPFVYPSTLKTTGIDKLYGGLGNDTYRIDSVDDITDEKSVLSGGVDTVEFKGTVATLSYTLLSGVENLTIKGNLTTAIGNNLNNTIIGDSAANVLKGLYGDDYLDGGTGTDKFEGGYGDDTYVVDSVLEEITEKDGQGNDWVQSEKISLDLNTNIWGGSIENGRLTKTTDNLNLFGSDKVNTLIGNDGDNILDGREGIDILQGGLGNDTYVLDNNQGIDTIVEIANLYDTTSATSAKADYRDTIQYKGTSTETFSLDSNSYINIENLTLLGSEAIKGTGNVLDNILLGNSANNTLLGLAGNDTLDGAGGIDTLKGGLGNDLYKLGNDDDVVVELAGEGTDTIESTKSLSLLDYSNIENLTLIGDALVATGNNDNNIIIGTNKANSLIGNDGADKLTGGEEADTLAGGKGADIYDLTESLAKTDTVVIGANETLVSATANYTEADRILKFALATDSIDLANTTLAGNAASIDGVDAGGFKSHTISNGFIKFDDIDTFTSASTIKVTDLNGAIEYLKANITGGATVAFTGYALDPNSTSTTGTLSTWIFQDNGTNDTLVALVGVTTATSFSTGAYSSTSIHIG